MDHHSRSLVSSLSLGVLCLSVSFVSLVSLDSSVSPVSLSPPYLLFLLMIYLYIVQRSVYVPYYMLHYCSRLLLKDDREVADIKNEFQRVDMQKEGEKEIVQYAKGKQC